MPGPVSWLSATLLLTVCLLCVQDVNAQYKRVCYFTSWAQYRSGLGRFNTSDIDPSLCTHIIYSFFKFHEENWTVFRDEWNAATLVDGLLSLRSSNPTLKILLGIGGYTFGTAKFSSMASTAVGRTAFVNSVIQTLIEYGFHGLDIDWEYPAEKDRTNFILLCQALNTAFKARSDPFLLTVAVPAGYQNIYGGYSGEAAQYVDFVNVMAYDYNGNWNRFTGHNAPLYSVPGDADNRFNVLETLRIYNEDLGIPREKLIVGMPTYGRTWTLTNPDISSGVHAPASDGPAAPYTQTAGQIAYYEICLENTPRVFDDIAQVPYTVNGNTWISYDDALSLVIKADIIINGGYGGAMFWTLDYDDFKNYCGDGRYPLMNAVKDRLLQAEGGTTPSTVTTITTTPTTTTATTTTPTTTSTTTASTTTTTTTTPTITTPGKPVALDCLERTDHRYARRNGYYANPYDCSRFSICFPIFSEKSCYQTFQCLRGQLFDVWSLSCKPQNEVGCECVFNKK